MLHHAGEGTAIRSATRGMQCLCSRAEDMLFQLLPDPAFCMHEKGTAQALIADLFPALVIREASILLLDMYTPLLPFR